MTTPPAISLVPPALRVALVALYAGVAADCITTYLTLQRQPGAEYNPLARALLGWGGWGALLGFQLLWCGLLLLCVLCARRWRPRMVTLLVWAVVWAAALRWVPAVCAALTLAHVL